MSRGRISQKDLTEKAGVSRHTIRNAESGNSINLTNLIKIADALGIHPADLFLTDDDRQEVTYKMKLLLQKMGEIFTLKPEK